MKYRRARPNDVPLLGRLNHQLIQDEGHSNKMTIPELADRMRERLVSAYAGILFEDDTGVVACALYHEEENHVYLRQFFVARDRRREGLGRRAMRILMAEVWPRGKRLTVSVLTENKPALAFWKAMGYEEYSLTLEIQPRKTAG